MAAKQRSTRKRRRETEYSESTSTVRLSDDVKQFITDKSRYNESIDKTLRRLLGMTKGKGTGRSQDNGGSP
jgi:hypothetical protein